MSLLGKNILANRFWFCQEASRSLEVYYQKTTHATKYRFSKRLEYKTLTYPPDINGETDYEISTKDEENYLIKKILKIKKHPEAPLFPDEYSIDGPPKGRVYEKLPFKFKVEAGKTYSVCSCGYSNSQPFCDGTHKMLWTTHLTKRVPKYRPIKYTATETKDVYFCNCKQSNNRPLCDGSHKLDKVTSGPSVK